MVQTLAHPKWIWVINRHVIFSNRRLIVTPTGSGWSWECEGLRGFTAYSLELKLSWFEFTRNNVSSGRYYVYNMRILAFFFWITMLGTKAGETRLVRENRKQGEKNDCSKKSTGLGVTGSASTRS